MCIRDSDYFAQLVEERSGGNITVAVFPNDQLANGNASRGIEMIASGSVDLAAYATCTLAVIDEKLPVATIPWIFDDYDEAVEVIDSTGKDYYAERLAAKGMTYLGSFHNGFRQLTNSKHEVRTPEDVQHLKIRVPGSVVFMGFFRALGADPTAMNWSEVFTAIQQGTLDGQETVSYTHLDVYKRQAQAAYDAVLLAGDDAAGVPRGGEDGLGVERLYRVDVEYAGG